MGTQPIVTYRDIDAWRAAMELTMYAYQLAKCLPATERLELSSQIRRAAVSIPADVSEGHCCGKDGRNLAHLGIALGSLSPHATGEAVQQLPRAYEEARPPFVASRPSSLARGLHCLSVIASWLSF